MTWAKDKLEERLEMWETAARDAKPGLDKLGPGNQAMLLIFALQDFPSVLRDLIDVQEEIKRLRGNDAPIPETLKKCSDCGRAMVWTHAGDSPRLICPNCVTRRMDAAETK
jgi:DNA-directed RNA polymerase subunit RPC12/RpoP